MPTRHGWMATPNLFSEAVDEAEDDAFALGLLAAYRALIVFEGVEQTAFLGIVLAFAFDALPFAVLGFARCR